MSGRSAPPSSEAQERDLAVARALMDEGRLEQAGSHLQAILRERPGWARGLNLLGIVLARQGRLDEAEQAFRRACEADPAHAAAWSNLGNVHFERGRWDEAEAAYRRALAVDPDYAAAHHNLAAVCRRTGRHAEAVRHLKRAARLEYEAAAGGSRGRGVLGWAVYLALAGLSLLVWLWRQGGRPGMLGAWGAALALAWVAAGQAAEPGRPEPGPAFERGVYIAGQDASGLTPQEVATQLQRLAAVLLDEPITLRRESFRLAVLPRELGIRPALEATVEEARRRAAQGGPASVPLRLAGPDPGLLEQLAGRLQARLGAAPVEPRLLIRPDGTVDVVAGRDGLEVDRAALARALLQASLATRFRVVEVPMRRVPPVLSEADLAPLKDPVPVSRYTTRLDPADGDRAVNVALAALALDGLVLPPGRSFSFNQAVGPRITERGYREAPVLLNGRFVTGVGGGVCQVSTTLYNAALLGGLAASARSPHSVPVWYVPLARDATVAYNLIDLRLVNPTPYPLAVQARLDGDRLTVSLWGPPQARTPPFRLRTVVEAAEQASFAVVEDPALPPGSRVVESPARTGYTSTLWREWPLYGPAAARERVNRSTYAPQVGLVRTGPPAVSTESRIAHAPAPEGIRGRPVKDGVHPAS